MLVLARAVLLGSLCFWLGIFVAIYHEYPKGSGIHRLCAVFQASALIGFVFSLVYVLLRGLGVV